VSVTWRSLSGRSTLQSAGEKGDARIAVDAEGERATSERLSRRELQDLREAIDEHLASWSSGPEDV
jgi:hypothetical protein